MKVKSDPRHKDRIKKIQALFSYTFHSTTEDIALIAPIIAAIKDIDTKILTAAPEWPLAQINKVDLAILRLAIFELESSSIPYKVVIDEAVELAKEYGSDNSPKFVNGVLGTILEKK